MERIVWFQANKTTVLELQNAALSVLQARYPLEKLDSGEFAQMRVKDIDFRIRHYAAGDAGHLLMMDTADSPQMQMATIVLTPLEKNLPLLSIDYMYIGETRAFLIELYALVEKRDTRFESFMERFTILLNTQSALPDMPMKPAWYDNLRPVSIAKFSSPENDEAIARLAIDVLELYAEMEQNSPPLASQAATVKRRLTENYVDRLLDDGGVTTDIWKQHLGDALLRRYYYEVFFGLDAPRQI